MSLSRAWRTQSTSESWRFSSASHIFNATLMTRLLGPKTTYFGRIVSVSVGSKRQKSFRNGYTSFSMACRLNTIGSTSTPMKNGNTHQTFRGDERRNGRQQIVPWHTIWWDSLGTFL